MGRGVVKPRISQVGSLLITRQKSFDMPSAKPQILISGALVWAVAEVDQLKADGYDVLVLDSPDRATFIKELTTGKYRNISAIYRHNSSASEVGFYDEELINAMPSSLRYLCHNGAGYDQIDIAACTAKGSSSLPARTPALANASAQASLCPTPLRPWTMPLRPSECSSSFRLSANSTRPRSALVPVSSIELVLRRALAHVPSPHRPIQDRYSTRA